MTRIITIKDVALRAGVSPKTVSRVLNDEAHVRPGVRAAVQQVIADLDYRPNAYARSLSSSRSYLLGLLLDDPGSGYAADIQLGALIRCRARGYHLVVEPVDVAADGWLSALGSSLRSLRLDGAMLTPPLCDNQRLLDLLDDIGLPYVRISPSTDIDRSGFVRMDDRAAAYEMTSYLLGLGHRVIGFIKGDPTHSSSAERFDGYCAALADAGGLFAHAFVREGDFSFRSGLTLGEDLLGSATLPSAIFSSNDDMALGVLISAIKLGIAVPGMLSVAGFDDAPTARAAWPQLTTIRQPKGEMAAAAVDILVDPRYRSNVHDAAFRRLLDYSLVQRSSTGRFELDSRWAPAI
ncbi:LacI family DNA-binding transcriptional regulator [Polymorphobacter sp. PAMC 29334]|uniref:LacI family DNA-binding transcriptional regulator n=1 Tax=Polymorphobacter sp. PAMC 29334 TaxID=2862331 RepID=UPI001C6768EF|nr:LacI family DNA-binding transcriptional regulator [Polymorphobacter sp. PAMC 29334]QYE35657.1 LacI family DNA-binding transcriptional regulator [Polymorphobacter sp. PAMC 29334]